MSIEPGIEIKFPGDTRIDLFVRPDLNRNEYDAEPLGFTYSSKLNLARLNSNEIPVRASDALLINNLKVLGASQTRKVRSIQIYQMKDSIAQSLLSSLRMYNASYQGDITPTSDYSCQMVAARLKDHYDLVERRLTRNQFVQNDYFGIIAVEANQGRTLIAFDKNWVLPAIATYIEGNFSAEMNRPVELREKMAERNPIENMAGTDYAQWVSIGQPRGEKININDLTIYPFQDDALTNDDGSPTECYMIFAPVSRDEAEKIYLYCYRDIQLYTDIAYVTVKDLALELARDFQYLFPVDVKTIGNYVVFSTDKINRDQFERTYKTGELGFSFPRLDDFTGAYGSYLLAESLYFQFPIRWENNMLYIGMCGYIQAQDIIENFANILNDLQRENPFYKILPNYVTATYLAQTTNYKCFYYQGKYYAAMNIDQEISTISDNRSNDEKEFDETYVEMLMPLIAVCQERTSEDARKYLRSLGYDINPNPDDYQNKIILGHRTIELNGKLTTNYYYRSTHGRELSIHQINGPHDDEIKQKLQSLFQRGYFFTQKTINLMRGYPDFIPSSQPINRQLSSNPKELLTELDNLIRGIIS